MFAPLTAHRFDVIMLKEFFATSFLLHLSALALLANSLPLSAFAIDEAKKRSSSAPRL